MLLKIDTFVITKDPYLFEAILRMELGGMGGWGGEGAAICNSIPVSRNQPTNRTTSRHFTS